MGTVSAAAPTAAPAASAGNCTVYIDFGNGTVEQNTTAVGAGWNGFNATYAANDSIGFDYKMNYTEVDGNITVTGFNQTDNGDDGNWTFFVRANETEDWYIFDGYISDVNVTMYTEILWNFTDSPLEAPTFTATPDIDEVAFNATGHNATGFEWDFGDGSSSTLEDPTHTYADSGVYDVTLTTTKGNFSGADLCADLTKQVPVSFVTVTIDNGTGSPLTTVVATDGYFNVNNATRAACTDLGIDINATGSENYTTLVEGFGDVNNTVNDTWGLWLKADRTADDYVLCTGYPDDQNATLLDMVLWNFSAPKVPQFTVSVDYNNVTFNASASGASSYVWNFGDGSAEGAGENVSHVYAAGGDFDVEVTCIYDDLGYGTATESVTVGGVDVIIDFGNGTSIDTTVALAEGDTGWDITQKANETLDIAVNYTDDDGIVVEGFGDVNNTENATWGLWLKESASDENYTLAGVTVDEVNASLYAVIYWNYSLQMDPMFAFVVNDLSVDFNATGSNANNYTWDFGDESAVAYGAVVSHDYAQSGDYTVVLTCSNDLGIGTSTQTVALAGAHVIIDFGDGTFNETDVPIMAGDSGWNITQRACSEDYLNITVNYTASDYGIWVYGFDGVMNDYPNETWGLWIMESASTDVWTLSSTGIDGVDPLDYRMILFNYSVAMMPWYSYDVDGLTVDFNATGSNADNYTWDFGDGSVGYGVTVSHDYAESGSYDVVLTCSNDLGTGTATQTFTIDGATVFFDFGNGTAVNATVTIMAGDSGWNVTVRAADALGLDLNYSEYSFGIVINGIDGVMSDYPNDTWGLWTKSVAGSALYEYSAVGIADVDPLVDRAILWSYDQTLNPTFTVDKNGLVVDLNASAIGDNLTYEWGLGDGSTANTSVVSHTYAASGNYIVTLVVENSYGFVEITQQVSVNKTVVAAFSYTPDTLELSVDASASEGDDLTYAWDFGDGSTGTGVTATHVYAAAGNYTVTLTVTDSHSVSADVSKSVVIEYVEPSASFTVTKDNLKVTVNASASTGDNLTYAWDFGDNSTGTGVTAEHEYSEAGTYNITLTVTDGNGHTATHVEEVTVEAPATDNTMLYAGIAIVIIVVVAIVAYMMMRKPGAGASTPAEPAAEEPSAEETSEEE